jgi:hypothetical protein
MVAIGDLDDDLLSDILNRTGVWQMERPEDPKCRDKYAPWSVCQRWRDVLLSSPSRLAAFLLAEDRENPHAALMKAVGCSNPHMDSLALVTLLLRQVADIERRGEALCKAAKLGHQEMVAMLLRKEYAPHANCQDGMALILAAHGGHEGVAQMLLEWKEHAPHADCQDGMALIQAAGRGHEGVVQMLLEWKEHAPHANCQDGRAIIAAARGGHEGVVRILLEWPEHAPRADCQDGEPLRLAVEGGHGGVVKMLTDAMGEVPY